MGLNDSNKIAVSGHHWTREPEEIKGSEDKCRANKMGPLEERLIKRGRTPEDRARMFTMPKYFITDGRRGLTVEREIESPLPGRREPLGHEMPLGRAQRCYSPPAVDGGALL